MSFGKHGSLAHALRFNKNIEAPVDILDDERSFESDVILASLLCSLSETQQARVVAIGGVKEQQTIEII